MDLSFARLDRDCTAVVLPTELAVLMVGIAARQAASPTARAQARLDLVTPGEALLAPLQASFHQGAALAFADGRTREGDVYPADLSAVQAGDPKRESDVEQSGEPAPIEGVDD